MTSDQYDKLSDEEKRIKVAELCGWEYHEATSESGDVDFWWKGGNVSVAESLPDYLNDLNACHEFEETMDEAKLRDRYSRNLYKVMQCMSAQQWNATAKQRCKAFVLTMGGE